MIELKKQAKREDPDREAKAWLDRLAEVDQMRRGYQQQAAIGYMTFDELGAALEELEHTRRTAERELAAIKNHQEEIEQLEHDKEMLLEHYVRLTPEAFDTLTPEERHHFCKMLRLKATAHVDGPIEIRLSGDAVSATHVSKTVPTHPSSSSRKPDNRR